MSIIIQAGGGVIINEKNEVLLIYRRKKWDLPKGKLDAGETLEECAIREVKEETGLQSIMLQDSIQFIKETHWYHMSATTFENEILTPQLEEEIEKIEWVDLGLLSPYLDNSYATIRQVLSLL
jgi:mutator protein MutT